MMIATVALSMYEHKQQHVLVLFYVDINEFYETKKEKENMKI